MRDFSIDYCAIDKSNILNIQKYLMIKKRIQMFGTIKKSFFVLLASIGNASNHRKRVSLTNQKCEIQPTLINLNPSECGQEFHYYPFCVKIDRCVGSCNTLNNLSNNVCIPNKTKGLNLSVLNRITGINKSETLTKYVSCECECRFDGKECNSNQWWNNN